MELFKLDLLVNIKKIKKHFKKWWKTNIIAICLTVMIVLWNQFDENTSNNFHNSSENYDVSGMA